MNVLHDECWIRKFNPDNGEPTGCTSKDYYRLSGILKKVDDAPSWDEFIYENEFTAYDCIMTLAEIFDIEPDEEETLDDLEDKLLDEIWKRNNEA